MSIEQINEIVSAADRVVTAIESKAAEIDNKTAQLASDYSSKKTALEQQIAESSAELAIVASAGYRKAIEDASGGRNTIVIDDQGNPNVMVRIPRFNYEDLNQAILDRLGVDLKLGTGTPTMFQRNGEEMGEVLIAKYLASSGSNGGCSVIGGVQPRTSVNYDVAKALCSNKGEGWHMMSIHEWAAIALWSLANDTEPRGNTNYGQSHDNKIETAHRKDSGMPGDISNGSITDTGSGPNTWSHDHTKWGVQDLVGNVWEWLDQMKFKDGQFISTLDNNPDIVEENWIKHLAFLDSPVEINEGVGNAGSPVLSNTITNRNGPIGNDEYDHPYLSNQHFAAIEQSPSYSKIELLRRLLIESESVITVKGYMYGRNYGTRFPRRGGHWISNAGSGLGALDLRDARQASNSGIGFRPAFFAQ